MGVAYREVNVQSFSSVERCPGIAGLYLASGYKAAEKMNENQSDCVTEVCWQELGLLPTPPKGSALSRSRSDMERGVNSSSSYMQPSAGWLMPMTPAGDHDIKK